jgi:hypothetical protein
VSVCNATVGGCDVREGGTPCHDHPYIYIRLDLRLLIVLCRTSQKWSGDQNAKININATESHAYGEEITQRLPTNRLGWMDKIATDP